MPLDDTPARPRPPKVPPRAVRRSVGRLVRLSPWCACCVPALRACCLLCCGKSAGFLDDESPDRPMLMAGGASHDDEAAFDRV